ncbi:MAG: tRNA (adenosine(37)-N6)-threonylcarbamoyltransferase complex dimerization subunit type 1 TsaB, partial [Bacteroidales bacterium]|nr:tRNA (adenosine(37)-N6)-threonylcarbamoyltransferase complex dimerization subunit type 1 TsaB [Bacteroidales bacterium]
SSPVCSVAIADENGIIAIKEDDSGLRHAALAPLFVEEMLTTYRPNAVVISAGPGSYTGLRIGTSLAKGICYGKGIPLIAVSTLRAMANGLPGKQAFAPNTLLIPMLDARRMEVYTAAYDLDGKEIMHVQPIILDDNSFNFPTDKQLICFGSGSEKAKLLFSGNKHFQFIDHFRLSAKYLLPQAIEKFRNNQFEDLSYFEPLYLKDFKITTTKKKLF